MKTGQQYHNLPPFPAHRCSVSGALLGIIAFILIAAAGEAFWLAGKTAGTRGLKVSASTTLGPRERVVIVTLRTLGWCWASPRQTSTFYINCRPPLLSVMSVQNPCGFPVRHEEFA